MTQLQKLVEMLDLELGAYPEAEALDEARDFELLEAWEKFQELLRAKMPKAWMEGRKEV